ncbi:MAG: hypothetical protein HRU33_12610 [Rhodobacteraceae bacterium]|nr:hypothetical protein [Paracoccaceae bacterium]
MICLSRQAYTALHMAKVHGPATASRQAAKCRAWRRVCQVMVLPVMAGAMAQRAAAQ